MTGMMVMFGVMMVMIFIGMPIGYAIGFSSIITFVFFSDISVSIVPQNAFTGLNSFVLLAVPFFIFAGVIMSEGGHRKTSC